MSYHQETPFDLNLDLSELVAQECDSEKRSLSPNPFLEEEPFMGTVAPPLSICVGAGAGVGAGVGAGIGLGVGVKPGSGSPALVASSLSTPPHSGSVATPTTFALCSNPNAILSVTPPHHISSSSISSSSGLMNYLLVPFGVTNVRESENLEPLLLGRSSSKSVEPDFGLPELTSAMQKEDQNATQGKVPQQEVSDEKEELDEAEGEDFHLGPEESEENTLEHKAHLVLGDTIHRVAVVHRSTKPLPVKQGLPCLVLTNQCRPRYVYLKIGARPKCDVNRFVFRLLDHNNEIIGDVSPCKSYKNKERLRFELSSVMSGVNRNHSW